MAILRLEDLDKDLPKALQNQEFILYYQPEYTLSTSKFAGVEALVRWQHPRYGMLPPKEFIKLAEDMDLIDALDRWVLKTACKQNKAWQEKGLPPMRIAVNVAAKQFDKPDFAQFVIDTLDELQLEHKFLELELNENMIINDTDKHIIETVKFLSRAGVQIALDDFGTGYSTISYLNLIPVDRIKIDKSYIDNISTDPKDAAIVKAIINLADDLKLQVLAEGIESLKQLQMVADIKQVEIQGFYFSEPLPPEQVEKFLLEKLIANEDEFNNE